MKKEMKCPKVVTCLLGSNREKQRKLLEAFKDSPIGKGYVKGYSTNKEDFDIHNIVKDQKELKGCVSLHIDETYAIGHKKLDNGSVIIADLQEIESLAKIYAVMLVADSADANNEIFRDVIFKHGIIGIDLKED